MNTPIDDATAQLSKLKTIWLTQVVHDCDRAAELLDSLTGPEGDEEEVREELHRIFHDMTGQAGLFGYPLLSSVAARFCGYWRGVRHLGGHEKAVARAHVLAARFVLDRHLEGGGGEAGQAIIAKLDALLAA
jgi:hypothetical protein